MDYRFPEPLERLMAELSALPTIGRKSAQRLAFHILKSPREKTLALATALRDSVERIRFCENCFFISEEPLCSICSDPARDRSVICVVEDPADVAALEKSGSYSGMYHVLMGHLSPLRGVTPDDLKIRELLARLQDSQRRAAEVILATNPDVDGDATALYLSRQLEALGVRVTRLGVGLPIGSSLDYIDELTLKRSIEGRREF